MLHQDDILESVLKEFEGLAAIPRPSGHEEAVSNFLKNHLMELGCQVTQDEVNNIIADIPATPGCEQAPRTILQGHMDMVCVAESGHKYEPLRDPIRLVRTEETLTADGTSLGADDGIGVAVAIHVLKHSAKHGPLRLVVTVDEERGMTGAKELSPKFLEDARFLINCDSENYDELTVGSAGSVNLDFRRELSRVPASFARSFRIDVMGLLGGHSGERIGEGRANALRTMALLLRAIKKKGDFELAELSGGKARNAIADRAKALIVTDLSEEQLKAVLQEEFARFQDIYGKIEKEASFTVRKAAYPDKVLTREERDGLLALLLMLHTGVFAMSQGMPTLVETSANLGVVEMDEVKVELEYFPRSSVDAKLVEFVTFAEELSLLTGFTAEIGTISPGWKENKESVLAELMTEVFKEQNGREMKVETIHAGLECSWHFKKNPKLDIVSIGVTTLDIHSPQETLVLKTVTPQVRLIMGVLEKIAAIK